MHESNALTEKPQEMQGRKHKRARVRPLHRWMESDELTPEERLDRVVEILTEGVMAIIAEDGG